MFYVTCNNLERQNDEIIAEPTPIIGLLKCTIDIFSSLSDSSRVRQEHPIFGSFLSMNVLYIDIFHV